MTKHTPGPWDARKRGPYEWAIDAVLGDHDIGMASWAELATAYGTMDEGKLGRDKAKANAQLIAAAPELLEQLKGLLDRHWDYMRDFEDLSPAYEAIAKAEGRA